ncbi:MAG: hypothetical protein HY744_32015 [Deltaproteobacteria bacterium]|nr:hypothetical protein [Deltaproteobacteria bacterium]
MATVGKRAQAEASPKLALPPGAPPEPIGRRASRSLARWLLLLAVGALGRGCGAASGTEEIPVATIGSTQQTELLARPLVRRWLYGTGAERQGLDRELARFCERFPTDELTPLVLGLRARNALERGDLGQARGLALRAALGPAGSARDLGTLVLGAVERRAGRYEQALERLKPLVHKMIEPDATALLDEELVLGAVGARRWDEALRLMGIWLRETDPAAAGAAAGSIEALLERVPSAALRRWLDVATGGGAGTEPGELQRLVVGRLAAIAQEKGDSALAQLLVDRYRALLGTRGEAVARLSTQTSQDRVAGRTVGLLLALGDFAARRRSAEVAAGVAFGLELPGPAQGRLVTREAPAGASGLGEAISALCADGAALVVAGVDAAQAERMAALAQEHALPVVLLAAPAVLLAPAPFAFVLGEDPVRLQGMLRASLGASDGVPLLSCGSAGPAGVTPATSPPADGARAIERSCADLPAPAELRQSGAAAVVDWDGSCVPDLVALAAGLKLPLGIGLGASPLADELPAWAQVLGAGVFPVDPRRPDARLRPWLQAGRGAPSWWAALGRDAAVLARQAVEGLPEDATKDDDRAEVASRRKLAARALERAAAALWTTEARGFDGRRRVPRSVRVLRAADWRQR